MSTWLYKQTEPTLWTVGHYYHDGTRDRFEPESDHGSAEEAAARVRYLNGGGPVGVCGARMTDSTGRWTHHFFCTETPGHVDQDKPDHVDGTRHGAPGATWRDPEPDAHPDAMVTTYPDDDEDDDEDDDGDSLIYDPDAMESMYPQDREDGEGLSYVPSYGE